MKELAEKYRLSLSLLRKRIAELTERRDIAIAACRRLHQDPKCDVTVIELEDRIRPLKNMYTDLREVTREIEHYYERSWWRSGKYTCNQNKPAPAKCDEEFYKFGFSITSNRKAKKSNPDVLQGRKNIGRNSRGNGDKESCCMPNS